MNLHNSCNTRGDTSVKAVLFDMDGTVLDTEPMYKKAWKAAFGKNGHEFSDELFNRCVGLSVPLVKKLLNDTYNDPKFFETTFPIAASWAFNYKKLNGVPVKKGFYELSEFLEQSDIVSVIATSTSHDAAVEDLSYSQIINRFKGVIGGDDVQNGKPNPDPYIKAAALAGFDVSECIAIEDSINGIRSAVAAGVRCIYIRDFLDIPREIEDSVYARCESLDEVIDIIKKINCS
jgi:beta-phosphoglucomutase-like phosphatase (HAD superfamily)